MRFVEKANSRPKARESILGLLGIWQTPIPRVSGVSGACGTRAACGFSGTGCVTWACCVSGLAAPKTPDGKRPVAVAMAVATDRLERCPPVHLVAAHTAPAFPSLIVRPARYAYAQFRTRAAPAYVSCGWVSARVRGLGWLIHEITGRSPGK